MYTYTIRRKGAIAILKRRSVRYFVLLLTAILFYLPFASLASAEPIEEIRQLIRDDYVDPVPESVLMKKTGKEITDALDPHSVYLSKKEYEGFINAIDQRIVGIGVVLEESEKGVKIISVIPNSPAEQAGILQGDMITAVNGTSIAGMAVQSAIALIGGDEGTVVTLTIQRPDVSKAMKIEVKRKEIHLPVVESTILGGHVGYIRLNSFSDEAAAEMNQAIRSMKEAESWIVDLRDNGGGYITAAQDVAGFFPNVSYAFQLREKNKQPLLYEAHRQKNVFDGQVALLLNEFSASASEMVAATVKEKGAATLYGQRSYGKGTMQAMYPFTDGSVLKLTTARFYSPGGQAVDQVGVLPDQETEIGEELLLAHRDLVLSSLQGYSDMRPMVNVPKTKTFTIEMNTPMNWKTLSPSAVQLIELGGEEVPVTVHEKNDTTLEVAPSRTLLAGGSYLLIVHPKVASKAGKPMKKGIYVDIEVK
ncbi:S41 family peptidase [Sporosarcina sp. Te-1]|uniref:S41 family peptidase n=1 Tax=Sporosarcina sp. Te-1 TaxID=2818390 RepID=UPI001A9F4100|nr:S41 family peptidase [Sporosarcina sp. Te-1]QTD41073.1 S41 family peptidase [Sporosarcina sp. Te-1]